MHKYISPIPAYLTRVINNLRCGGFMVFNHSSGFTVADNSYVVAAVAVSHPDDSLTNPQCTHKALTNFGLAFLLCDGCTHTYAIGPRCAIDIFQRDHES